MERRAVRCAVVRGDPGLADASELVDVEWRALGEVPDDAQVAEVIAALRQQEQRPSR